MRSKQLVAAALALTVGAMSFTGAAEARGRHHHGGGGAAAAAGIFGFAAGAMLGSALSQPRHQYYYADPEPVYVAPPPPPVVYQYQPAPAYVYAAPEPWTGPWYDYCESRYRSFDARTGYFLGYDQQYHFCR